MKLANVHLLWATSLVFSFTALIVWLTGSNQWLFLTLNKEFQLLPDAFWSNMTFVADTLFAVALITLFASYRHPKLFNSGLLLLIVGGIFVHAMKFAFDAPRPGAVLDTNAFHIIGPLLKWHSFPSGHSFTALASFGLLALYSERKVIGGLLLTIGAIAALSRIAVGAHWPLDVLLGSATGLIFAIGVKYCVDRVAYLGAQVIQYIAAALMLLSCVALIFHDSNYPYTRVLSTIFGILACLAAAQYFYKRLNKKNKQQISR